MNRVAIDELRLRIPGVDEAAARAIAARVADELAARADAGPGAGDVGELRLTVPWKPGTATDEVVRQAARELLRALRQIT